MKVENSDGDTDGDDGLVDVVIVPALTEEVESCEPLLIDSGETVLEDDKDANDTDTSLLVTGV